MCQWHKSILKTPGLIFGFNVSLGMSQASFHARQNNGKYIKFMEIEKL